MLKKVLLLGSIIYLFFSYTLAFSSGNKVPNISFYTARGEKLSFKELQGKVILVNFFATYCPSCQVEISEFVDLYKELRSKGLEIIGFLVDRGGEFLLPQIIMSRGIEYYVSVADNKILSAFGWPDLLPTTFIINKKGYIVGKIIGYRDKQTLKNQLLPLLKGS